jgi:UDP-glucose 4-epimerase
MPDSADRLPVLVTGCSGLIGTAVAERLAPDYDVVGLDVEPPPEGTPVDFVEVDLTSGEDVAAALDRVRERHGSRIASVVHLAAYYDFSGAPSELYDALTVGGTERLLRHLQAFDAEQFVFSSTMLVHEPVEPGERVDEEAPIEAKWPYPESKVAAERAVREQRGPIPAVLLRIAGVYTDYGQQPTLVQQIRRIYERDFESHLFPGDPDAGQAFVHVDDTADAVVRAVERRSALPGEAAVLIGEPDPPSYQDLQDRIGELVWGDEWGTVRIPQPVAKAGAWAQDVAPGVDAFIKPFMIDLADDHYALDIDRARDLLDWAPRHRVLDVLPAIVGLLTRDPRAWYERNGLEPPDDPS